MRHLLLRPICLVEVGAEEEVDIEVEWVNVGTAGDVEAGSTHMVIVTIATTISEGEAAVVLCATDMEAKWDVGEVCVWVKIYIFNT